MYHVAALSLYPERSPELAFSAVAEGLAWAARPDTPNSERESSISELRSAISSTPLRDLWRTFCLPLVDD